MADQQAAPQQDQDTIRYEVFTGLRNDRPVERFEHTDLAVGTNIDIDNSGSISRRPGYTQVLAGAFHSVWSDNSQCLLVNGGQLKRADASYNLTTLKTLAGATSRISYSKINSRIYFASETDTGIIEQGIARSWGIAVPGIPGVSVGAGNMLAGTYQFSLTYMRADGQESGATLAGTVAVPGNSGLTFALPMSTDPTVVLKNLYLTTPNGEILYWALSVPNTQLTATYVGDTLELNLPLLTQFLGPAPTGQIVGYYSGHVFVASGDTLYPSEPLAHELFDLRKGIHMDGRITMFAAMEDKERQGVQQGMDSGLFVGTDRSCGVLIGKDDFQYVPKVDYGAIEGAMAYVDGSLYGDNSAGARMLPMWLTTQGICVGMPQMELRNITRTKYGFQAARNGAAMFQPGPNKFVAVTNF